MNQPKNILITGGCGFIGSNLVMRLVSAGYSVRILDNLSRGRRWRVAGTGVEVLEGDVRDPQIVGEAMSGMDTVIHLAAYGSVVESVETPSINFEQNVAGTFTILEGVRKFNIGKMVFASTGGALIGDAEPPVNEDSLPKPISPYGASKLCGEAYCHAFAKAYGIKILALRFANVYGPHSAHKKGAVTSFIKAVMNDEPMVIYGDGSASRDFLYVTDLCKGIELGLAADVEPGLVLHLASGVETRIGDLARAVASAGGRPCHPIEYRECRSGEVNRNFARYDRAHKLLGFEPNWSLDAGLATTWDWFREQRESVLNETADDS
jgi:UDP-glucose 4-epimerase